MIEYLFIKKNFEIFLNEEVTKVWKGKYCIMINKGYFFESN